MITKNDVADIMRPVHSYQNIVSVPVDWAAFWIAAAWIITTIIS